MKEYFVYNTSDASVIWAWLHMNYGGSGASDNRWKFKEKFYTAVNGQSNNYIGTFTIFDDSDYMEFMLKK